MDIAFKRACHAGLGLQAPAVVFGLKLRPLTLGHVFLLESLDSPVLRGSPDLFDWMVATFVCSQPSDQARSNLSRWWFPWFCLFWSWRLRRLPGRVLEGPKTFWAYLESNMDAPRLRPVSDGGRVCSSPSSWIKLWFAMHLLHLSKSAALEMEIIELNALYAVWAEWSGGAEVMSREEGRVTDLREYARQQDALKFNTDGTRKEGA